MGTPNFLASLSPGPSSLESGLLDSWAAPAPWAPMSWGLSLWHLGSLRASLPSWTPGLQDSRML